MGFYMPVSARHSIIGIGLSGLLCVSIAGAGERDGTEWRVTSCDTLYQIGRSIYPEDAARQTRLRQDIMILNPDQFAGNRINLQPGDVLQLPRYVVDPDAAGPEPVQIQPAPVSSWIDATDRSGWTVQPGETLYSISRAIHPDDRQKQSILRRDIVLLNPTVFNNGNDNLAAGSRLTLPNYVAPNAQAMAAKKPEPVIEPEVAEPAEPEMEIATPEPATPEPAVEITTVAVSNKPDAEPTPVLSKPKEEKTLVVETAAPRGPTEWNDPANTNWLVSLGISAGGDELVSVDSGLDITGGSGINLRLGYQHMPRAGSGYRATLGLQYHPVDEASLTDYYLQLAYQYRADPFVYGVGLVTHAGAEVEDVDLELNFDPATGAYVYIEGVGDTFLSGWGLSLTSLEIEEEDTGEDVDASNAEIYYSWYF